MNRTPLMTLLAVAFGCGAVALGCGERNESGSSGLIPIPPIDVTGTWTGTWSGNNGSGAIQFDLVQIDPTVPGISSVQGTTTFTDFFDGVVAEECFTSGSFVGSITGVKVAVISILNIPKDVPNFILEVQVEGSLDALGNVMKGNYLVKKGKPRRRNPSKPGEQIPNCTGFSGTIEVSRPPAP